MPISPSPKHIRIFAASPGDVFNEREQLGKVVEELNTTTASFLGFSLELVRWETHCRPAMGRAQSVVNAQIGSYDIFIGLMWKRFGKPTGHAQSGTEEEFRIAYEAWQRKELQELLFYFCQQPFMPHSDEELEQFRKVLAFRRELSEKGLIGEYDGHDAFADTIRPHLTRLLHDRAKGVEVGALPETAIDPLADDVRPPHYYENG